MNKTKRVILLTACVNPNGMIYTAIQDSTVRKNQYIEVLNWYLENTEEKIVFVENTMADISSQFTEFIKSGRLEYITFNGNDYDRTLGKGYGEALIIKTALEKSQFITEQTVIIKITGRLKITNINKLLKEIKSHRTIYCNTYLENGRALCNSTFFVAPHNFLSEYFMVNIYLLNDSKVYYFEHLLYDTIINWKKNNGTHSDFRHPILINGLSGTTGKNYMESIRFASIRSFFKYIAHRYGIYRNRYQ